MDHTLPGATHTSQSLAHAHIQKTEVAWTFITWPTAIDWPAGEKGAGSAVMQAMVMAPGTRAEQQPQPQLSRLDCWCTCVDRQLARGSGQCMRWHSCMDPDATDRCTYDDELRARARGGAGACSARESDRTAPDATPLCFVRYTCVGATVRESRDGRTIRACSSVARRRA